METIKSSDSKATSVITIPSDEYFEMKDSIERLKRERGYMVFNERDAIRKELKAFYDEALRRNKNEYFELHAEIKKLNGEIKRLKAQLNESLFTKFKKLFRL